MKTMLLSSCSYCFIYNGPFLWKKMRSRSVETVATTRNHTDDVTSCCQFQVKVHLMEIRQEVDWGRDGSERNRVNLRSV